MSISQSAAFTLLQPYLQTIQHCILEGWTVYQEKYIEVAPEHSATTRPGIIRDHIVARIRRAIDSERDVKIIEKKNGLFCLVVDQIIAIRFKKLDRNKWPSNNVTRQSRTFIEQLVLPGFPPDCTYVNAGYIPNKLWTDIEGIYITCHNRSRGFEWIIQILDGASGLPSNVVPLDPNNTLAPSSRVRVKKDIQMDEKDDRTRQS